MWWLFKRSTDDKKWKKLQVTLKNSFSNIKGDIDFIRSNEENQDRRLEFLENKLTKIEGFVDGISQLTGLKTAQPKEEEIITEPIQNNLTDLQKSILHILSVLSKESSQRWVGMRTLTRELYPKKDYNSVKSLLSNYTDVLLQLNLILKRRKGRQIFLALTDKSKQLLPKKQIIKKVKKKS